MSSLEDEVEIANPQQPHCATILVIDVSGSMAGNIGEVNRGLESFKRDILADRLASQRVDLAIVSFGGSVKMVQDFTSMEDFSPPQLVAGGDTPMGMAIETAIDRLAERKKAYDEMGTDYFRPWIFLITDGAPTDMTDGDQIWARVVAKVHEGEKGRHFSFFAVGVEGADFGVLKKIAPPNREPIQMKMGQWAKMFEWLSKSQKKVSNSRPGENVQGDNPLGSEGWATIPA